jgi:prophage DNA circulation protein
MSWQDRIAEAAFTSVSGRRFTFDFTDVSRNLDMKGTPFNFVDADGTYVQQFGKTGRRYPLKMIIWGDDYDQAANEAEDILSEQGVGVLEHPTYGTVNVVVIGPIARRDDLVEQANQAIIQVELWDTIGVVFPSAQDDPTSNVLASIDAYNAAASNTFNEALILERVIDEKRLENSVLSAVGSVKAGLDFVASTQEDVKKQFDTIFQSINSGIDLLVADPLTLGFQITQLIQSPSRAFTDIQARLDAYSGLLTSLIGGENNVVNTISVETNNQFHSTDLFASTIVSSYVTSVVNNEFETKIGALTAAEFLIDQFNELVVWRDDNFVALEQLDTGESYQQLENAISLAAGFLVQISFTLKQERSIVLVKDRTIIDLAAQLYGEIDERLDFLIDSNNLSGSEILELKKGRKIVYYI